MALSYRQLPSEEHLGKRQGVTGPGSLEWDESRGKPGSWFAFGGGEVNLLWE